MNRVFAHEGIGDIDRLLLRVCLVIRVHEFQLNLRREFTERESRLKLLVDLDGAPVVAPIHRILCLLVSLGDASREILTLVVTGASGQTDTDQQYGQPSAPWTPGGLLIC